MKRIISTLMMLVMVTMVFSGCGKKGATSSSQNESGA